MGLLPKHELDALERDVDGDNSANGQLTRFSIALQRFIWAFADSIRIPQLVDWLSRRLFTK